MAFTTSLKYMCMLDTNLLSSPSVTHVWATSNMTLVSGQGTTMLDDDDATSLLKGTATGSSATIEVEWRVGGTPTAQSVSAFGM